MYKVRVGKFPQCNCPDFKIRKNLCKHYLYVMIRVLRLREDDPLVWQRALLLSEVEEVSAPGICSYSAKSCMQAGQFPHPTRSFCGVE